MDLSTFATLGLTGLNAYWALLILCASASYVGGGIMYDIGASQGMHPAQLRWMMRLGSVVLGLVAAWWIAGATPLSLISGAVAGACHATVFQVLQTVWRGRLAGPAGLQQQAFSVVGRLTSGATFMLDKAERVTSAEGRLLGMAGLMPHQLVGRTISDACPPEMVGQALGLYRRGLAGQRAEQTLLVGGHQLLVHVEPLLSGVDVAGVVVTVEPTGVSDVLRQMVPSQPTTLQPWNGPQPPQV